MKIPENTSSQNHSYSIGVMLAVNAVTDAFLLLDAPVCAQWRAGYVHGSHDATSTLWDPSGVHRVQVSCTTTELIVSGNQEDLSRRMRRMAAVPGCGAVMAVGFPLASISGMLYKTIWRNLKPAPKVPFFQIDGGNIALDWLDGYAHTLRALARGLALPKRRRRSKDVAIVGYMFDRAERDHAANIAELKRMLAGLDLNLVSVWPGGVGIEELKAVASAGTILSFPYGREAAAVLAKRLGASLVECRLPLGLSDSADWLVEVGAALGCRAKAKAFNEAELGRITPRLSWATAEIFLHSRFVFSGDPVLLRPLARQLSDVGGKMLAAITMGGAHHTKELGAWDDLPFSVHEAPYAATLEKVMRGLTKENSIDCFIGTTDFPMRTVELGYPSFHSHAFSDRPYLGFEGAACLLSRLAEELLWTKQERGPEVSARR